MMQFKSGDIVKMRDDARLGVEITAHSQTPSFKYIVLGVGKYPGYVKTYCIKGPKRWLGNVYNFNESVVEITA